MGQIRLSGVTRDPRGPKPLGLRPWGPSPWDHSPLGVPDLRVSQSPESQFLGSPNLQKSVSKAYIADLSSHLHIVVHGDILVDL